MSHYVYSNGVALLILVLLHLLGRSALGLEAGYKYCKRWCVSRLTLCNTRGVKLQFKQLGGKDTKMVPGIGTGRALPQQRSSHRSAVRHRGAGGGEIQTSVLCSCHINPFCLVVFFLSNHEYAFL